VAARKAAVARSRGRRCDDGVALPRGSRATAETAQRRQQASGGAVGTALENG
jgi:hypothetical protein